MCLVLLNIKSLIIFQQALLKPKHRLNQSLPKPKKRCKVELTSLFWLTY